MAEVNSNRRRPRRGSHFLHYLLGTLVAATSLTSWLSLFFKTNGYDDQKDAHPLLQALRTFRTGTVGSAHSAQIQDHVPVVEESSRGMPIAKNSSIHAIAAGWESFSACLLVMDDNHRLVEWLAYHWHVLPLRYLIVAVDPRSKTSPTEILDRWRKLGMHIEEWDDLRFLKEELAKNQVQDTDGLQVKRDRHRMRQKNFYQSCLKEMKRANRTFVALIDTDEFITYNHKGGEAYEIWEKQQQKLHTESRFADQTRLKLSAPPPTTGDEGQLLPFIRREQEAGHPFFQSPCISMPRLQFSALESTAEERQNGTPGGFDLKRIDTLRFRKHAYRNDFVKNGLGKVIIDVSRVANFPRIMSLHRPIKTVCGAPWNNEWSSGLRVNHYLGSWEAYSYRDDARRGGERSKEGWAFKAYDGEDSDDVIRPWFSGFVESHGRLQAEHLLKGAGLPSSYKNPNETGWTIMFLDEILEMNETKGNDIRVQFNNFVKLMHGINQTSHNV